MAYRRNHHAPIDEDGGPSLSKEDAPSPLGWDIWGSDDWVFLEAFLSSECARLMDEMATDPVITAEDRHNHSWRQAEHAAYRRILSEKFKRDVESSMDADPTEGNDHAA